MEKYILSKSTFIRSWQCLKSLYLYKNKNHLRDPITAQQQALFSRGGDIGLLARKLFPGGVDASPSHVSKFHESVARTQELISQGVTVIYEAAFQHERVLSAIDILVKHEDGWRAYEVKSSTRITHIYILDASLQYYVMQGSGLMLKDISIVNINTSYVRGKEVDPSQLFNITSVLEDVHKHGDQIQQKVERAKKTIFLTEEPLVEIGEHCFSPYACDFRGYCWKNLPNDSVFDIAGLSKAQQFELYQKGFVSIKDVPADNELAKSAKLQVEAFKENAPKMEKDHLDTFLCSLRYPLSFLDFETFMPAVPIFPNTSPYQHIPFQYSLHCKATPESEARHKEYLAQAGFDPRKEFLMRLLNDTELKGDILVYNAQFEKSVLQTLKNSFPQYSLEIEDRLARIKDLMVPFQNKWYYHPMMRGSYSIKNVLPAMVPGLQYDELTIANGTVAMAAFEQLQKETDIMKIADAREALLTYCKMDTYGMVKILEALEKAVSQ